MDVVDLCLHKLSYNDTRVTLKLPIVYVVLNVLIDRYKLPPKYNRQTTCHIVKITWQYV